MVWKIFFRILQSLIGIGGLIMGGFGIYFDSIQALNAPNPLGLSLLAWGFILFAIASISEIILLHSHIYKMEHTMNLAIKTLKKLKVSGDIETYAEIIYKHREALVSGIPQYGFTNDYQPPISDDILSKLYYLKIVQLRTRRHYQGYDVYDWVITDFGRQVINHLEEIFNKKQSNSHKGDYRN